MHIEILTEMFQMLLLLVIEVFEGTAFVLARVVDVHNEQVGVGERRGRVRVVGRISRVRIISACVAARFVIADFGKHRQLLLTVVVRLARSTGCHFKVF